MPYRNPWRHRRLISFGTTLGTLAVLLIGSVATASAAPQLAPATPLPFAGAVSEGPKVTLPETSITAPGFYSLVNQPTAGTVIAWAGTDAAHRLNVETSADGLHYDHKITLADTSDQRPAVVQMSQAAGGAVILAWTGTDAAHRLNVLFDVYGSRQKLTLADNSFTGPALTIFNGNLLLGWTGTNVGHSLNVRQILLAPLREGPKTILGVSSNSWPNLTTKGHDTVFNCNINVVLAFENGGNIPQKLQLAESCDGSHFSTLFGTNGLAGETSAFGPDYLWFPSEGGPGDWIGWTGTDAAHHLNVLWTSNYPQWNGTKTTLPETALGGPMLGFDEGLLIAWTGTDAAHHLNVARLSGF